MRILLAAVALALFSFQVVELRYGFDRLWRPETEANPGFHLGAPWPTVVDTAPEAAAAGLGRGDRLVEIAGRAFDGLGQLDRALAARFPGDQLSIRVRKPDGTEKQVSWRLAPVDAGPTPWTRWLYAGVTAVCIPLLCLFLGVWTVASRPRDGLAWLLLFLTASFSFAFRQAEWPGAPLGFQLIRQFFSVCWPLAMALFGWYFPASPPFDRRYPWIKILLLAPIVIMIATYLALRLWNAGDSLAWAGWIDTALSVERFGLPIQMATVGIFFAMLGWKTHLFRGTDQRRRIQTILVGSALAMTPTLLLLLARLGWGLENEVAWAGAILMTAGFPLTLAQLPQFGQ